MFRHIFHEWNSNRSKREIHKGTTLVYYADISLKIIARRSGKYVRLLRVSNARQDDK